MVAAVPLMLSLNTPVPSKLSMTRLCKKTPFASVVRRPNSTDTLVLLNSLTATINSSLAPQPFPSSLID